ncbi:MAG: hypothetical protein DCC71_18780 [Proteobacteria bacterium]|nr:MAG: hypothetical protein DCC71_18780 [Pseudomonadota bacterium]
MQIAACAVASALCAIVAPPVHAQPASVTIAGSLQSELGCPGDWDPSCAVTNLAYDASDEVWQGSFSLPAGAFEYKAALNGSWDLHYGAFAQQNGANLALDVAAPRTVKFYYDDAMHWITDSLGSRIVTAPGSHQSELGCPGDWQPDCLRAWLQDPDGDGVYERTTTALPAGAYETKAAVGESWDENYGAGGVLNGPQIAFAVAEDFEPVTFRFDGATNELTVHVPEPPAATLAVGAVAALVVTARSRRRRSPNE